MQKPAKKYLNTKIDEIVIRDSKRAAALKDQQLNEYVEDALRAANISRHELARTVTGRKGK